MANVTLTINDKAVTVPAGTTVLEAARQAGFFIPTLCHSEENPGFGACRMCVVEIQGARNLPASCVTEAANGMVVDTESPAVIEARRTIIELLLANHPTDCLTCDKNGDCRLQEYAYRYDVKKSSFEGQKKSYPIDDSNPYILRDSNKCILCGKCVSICQEVEGRAVIDFAHRGFNTIVTPAIDQSLGESDCVYCARCVAVCPVAALTYKPMAGKGRAWEFTKKSVTCKFCDSGCKFNLNIKDGKVVGVAAQPPGKSRPLCLKGRLGIELLYVDQPLAPMLKKDGEFVEVTWAEALNLDDVLEKLKAVEK
ncbi:MAG TPA: 2Fe-2S iron-sulfur cluster-binding protein [Methylomusa anaerophila]|uniref:NADP-reducing hydrogenase subunit HndC n=1 Tax=Methylomusa anaerophila TaxID=1930071 RepID=A0A348AFC9_9FIRM|nr:2Fe-2S iron-sulfur cluster-binding protein [Methylomusa anaerophila]BBB89777.1 NADP-reducing hydrogenase subunit HndC [Methylomusa anaerophila]HML89177.1 2Fe-2S iron-sulfur cluster-binding protein [Methylomusa anaerophila]